MTIRPVRPIITFDTVTIPSGASTSNNLELFGHVLLGITVPAAWTAAGITFQVAAPGETPFYVPLHGFDGLEVGIASAAPATYYPFDPMLMVGVDQVAVRSGTAGAPVNQGVEREILISLGKADAR